MKNLVYLSLSLLACSPSVEKSPASKADLYQAYIDELVARGQFNGNVLVAEQGEVVFKASIGLNAVDGDSLSLDSQFRLASVSKQFTCAAIMTLQQKGLLAYDDPVQKYVPEWPYPATIRQLMHHTSGSPSYESLFTEQWMPELAEDDSARLMKGNEHMVSFIVEHQPEPYFSPGERYQYSNTAYVLLATIVSRISGQPFEDYMREEIYLPAGMQDTYVLNPWREDPLKRRAFGFLRQWDGKSLAPLDFHFLNAVAGDGGTYSTLDDLYAWNEVLYSEDVISKTSLEEAFQPAILNDGDTSWYGFGWGIRNDKQLGRIVSHGGSWVGFRTWIERMLDDRSCIVVLTNHNSLYLEGVVDGLRDIIRGGTYELPKQSASLKLMEILQNEGVDAARATLDDFKKDPANYEFVEWHFNSLGYESLALGQKEQALFFFTVNSEEHPNSSNVWDSLGDGHLAAGDTTSAAASFEKALAINPNLSATAEKLESLSEI